MAEALREYHINYDKEYEKSYKKFSKGYRHTTGKHMLAHTNTYTKWGWLSKAFKAVGNAVTSAVKEVEKVAEKVVNALPAPLANAAKAVAKTVSSGVKAVGKFVSDNWETIKTVGSVVWNVASFVLPAIAHAIVPGSGAIITGAMLGAELLYEGAVYVFDKVKEYDEEQARLAAEAA